MSRAVCLRCGAEKGAYDRICPACGHRPDGEGLLVAWLLSDDHLGGDALDTAAERIRGGMPLRPSEAMLQRARRALGLDATRDPGLPWPQRAALLVISLVLTPLVGLTCWFWWRGTRPRSATQAFWLSVPAGVLVWGGVIWIRLGGV